MESVSIATDPQPEPASGGATVWFGPWNRMLLAFWVLIYFACSALKAIKKPLWYDEIFSLDLASLPRFTDFWNALRSGTDFNPPLYYLAARALFALTGPTPLGLRLPSIVGYLVMSLCLYRFAVRRVPPAYAWAAASFPLITQAYGYAFEGRPYGMVLGLSGLALVGWQAATENEGTPRRLALALMTLSLAAALYSHYFAVLVFVPIGLGELARSWTRRSIDAAIWVALFAGLLPLLPLREFIAAASASKGTFWARPSWSIGVQFYLFLLKGTTIPFVFLLAFLAIESRSPFRVGEIVVTERTAPRIDRVPVHEQVAALGFVALPFVGLIVAKVAAGGAFTERYALPAVLGFALLIAFTADRLEQHRLLPGTMLALAFFGWFLVYEVYHLRREPEAHAQVSAADFTAVAKTPLPLVFSWSIMYLQAQHDLPADLSKRAYFLPNGHSTDEVALTKLSRWVPLNVVNLDDFVRENQRFFLCGFPNDETFLALLDGPYSVKLIKSFRFREGEVVVARIDRQEVTASSPTKPRITPAHEAIQPR